MIDQEGSVTRDEAGRLVSPVLTGQQQVLNLRRCRAVHTPPSLNANQLPGRKRRQSSGAWRGTADRR